MGTSSGGGAGVVICQEQGEDLHVAQMMPLPLTVSCFSKIQISFTFLELAHLGSPGKGPLNGCMCVIRAQAHLIPQIGGVHTFRRYPYPH